MSTVAEHVAAAYPGATKAKMSRLTAQLLMEQVPRITDVQMEQQATPETYQGLPIEFDDDMPLKAIEVV